MTRTKRAIQGMVTGYLAYAVITVIQIYLSPLILKKYGQDTLGAYASVMQLIGYLTLIDGALSLTFNRFIAQAFGSANKEQLLLGVFSTARVMYLIASLFNSVAIFGLSFFIGHVFGLHGFLEQDLKISLLILSVATLLKAPFTVYGTFLNAAQQMSYLNIVNIISNIIRGVLIISLINLDFGIKGIVIGNLVAEFMNLVASYVYFNSKFPGMRGVAWSVTKSDFRETLLFSKDSFVIQVANKIQFQTDTLLVGIFLSVSAASVFYSSITPPLLCFTLANILMSNVMPAMNEIVGAGDLAKIKLVYLKLFRFVLGLSIIVFFGVLFLNKYVVQLWVGIGQYAGWEVNLLFAIHVSILIVASFNGNFLVSIGKINTMAKYTVYVTIAGLLLSVLLLKLIGVVGLMAGTLLVSIPGTVYCFYLIDQFFGERIFMKFSTYWPKFHA